MMSVSLVLVQLASFLILPLGKSWLPATNSLSARFLASATISLAAPITVLSFALLFGFGMSVGIGTSVAILGILLVVTLRRGFDRASIARVTSVGGLLAAGVLGLLVLVSLFASAIKPETSWDALMYHAPAMANIVAKGSLWGWESSNEWLFYPDSTAVANAAWNMDSGRVMLEDAVAVPFLPLAFLTLMLMAGTRSINVGLRALLVGIAFLAPIVWLQLRMFYVDLPGTSMMLAGVGLALAAHRVQSLRAGSGSGMDAMLLLATAALATGVGIAAKPSLLPAAVLTVGFIVFQALRMRLLWPAVLIPVAALAVGAPFYVRNTVQFGSPTYPVALSLGPIAFPGIVDSGAFVPSGAAGLVDPERLYDAARNVWVGVKLGVNGSYGPGLGGFGRIPAVAGALSLGWLAVVRHRSSITPPIVRAALFEVLAVGALVAMLVITTTNALEPRYLLLPYLLTWGIAVGWLGIIVVPKGVAVPLGAAAVGVLTVALLRAESFGNFSIAESVDFHRGLPGYNSGATSPSFTVGDRLNWIPDGDCVDVVVQTSGGLSPNRDANDGYLNMFPYGYWGDHLCNRPFFVSFSGQGSGWHDQPDAVVLSRLQDAEYLVGFAEEEARWQELAERAGVRLTTIRTIDPIEWAPVAQTVYAVEADDR